MRVDAKIVTFPSIEIVSDTSNLHKKKKESRLQLYHSLVVRLGSQKIISSLTFIRSYLITVQAAFV